MFINHTHFSIRLFQLFAIIEKLTHLGSFTSQGSREFEKEKFPSEGRKKKKRAYCKENSDAFSNFCCYALGHVATCSLVLVS